MGPADAQVEAEAPAFGYLEKPFHGLWVQNRQHAHAQAVCAGGQIQVLDGHGGALLQCLGHGVAAQAVAGCGVGVGEYGQLQGGGLQAFEL